MNEDEFLAIEIAAENRKLVDRVAMLTRSNEELRAFIRDLKRLREPSKDLMSQIIELEGSLAQGEECVAMLKTHLFLSEMRFAVVNDTMIKDD